MCAHARITHFCTVRCDSLHFMYTVYYTIHIHNMRVFCYSWIRCVSVCWHIIIVIKVPHELLIMCKHLTYHHNHKTVAWYLHSEKFCPLCQNIIIMMIILIVISHVYTFISWCIYHLDKTRTHHTPHTLSENNTHLSSHINLQSNIEFSLNTNTGWDLEGSSHWNLSWGTVAKKKNYTH